MRIVCICLFVGLWSNLFAQQIFTRPEEHLFYLNGQYCDQIGDDYYGGRFGYAVDGKVDLTGTFGKSGNVLQVGSEMAIYFSANNGFNAGVVLLYSRLFFDGAGEERLNKFGVGPRFYFPIKIDDDLSLFPALDLQYRPSVDVEIVGSEKYQFNQAVAGIVGIGLRTELSSWGQVIILPQVVYEREIGNNGYDVSICLSAGVMLKN